MEQLTQFLITHNVSPELLTLLVFISVTTTLSNLLRYVFGVKSLGLYPVIMLALAFYLTGGRNGLILTAVIITITLATHELFRKIRMHYLSRIALNYISISIVIILILLIADLSGLTMIQSIISSINPISVVIISTLSDYIIKLYVKKDITSTVRSIVETVVISLVGWTLIRIDPIRLLFTNNLWLLLLLIPINILIGRSTSLRLTEYIRFKKIADNATRLPDRK